MSLALKICGMREAQNIRDVAALQPDYMGFIFYPASPRFVGDEFMVPTDFPPTIKRVGVFVNTETHAIIEQAKIHSLDYVQLHSNESVAKCEKIASAGYSIIKVFSVDEQFDFNTTNQFQHCADYFLFDTKGKYYGGNATSFEWTLLTKYNHKKPFFLSGGITVDQVAAIQALQGMNIHALDVNSGVEVTPAVKSINKIKEVKQALSARML